MAFRHAVRLATGRICQGSLVPRPGLQQDAFVATLLFVYNADGTLTGLVSDFAHRTFKPDTYPCNLCDVTYDRFTMKKDWKQFVKALPVDVAFKLRNTFRKKHPNHAEVPLPAAFWDDNGSLELAIDAERFSAADTIDAMKQLVNDAIAARAANASAV